MKLVFIDNQRPVTDSLIVSETFGKRHADVMRDIRNLDCSEEFNQRNFAQIDYTDESNRTYPKYLITQDGFSFLVMGYTGKEAARFKEMYINEFNRMKNELIKPQHQLPQNYKEALIALVGQVEKTELLEAENHHLALQSAEQKQKLIEQETPVAIYNLAIAAHNTMSMQEIAKSLGTGRTKLYNILREEKVVMKNSTMPYQRFLDDGYFKVTERPRASGDTIINDPATRVTAKGFEYIAKIIQRRASNS